MNKTRQKPPATTQDFPIVGIGASAGGLDAFKEFLRSVPENSGMAFVLVQHLHPSHDSILTEILTRCTKVPVVEITDDIHLAPNHVYVIPENKILTSTDGVLKLSPREKETRNVAIDIFFASLAEVHLNLAVGVILSGMGTDGTLGLKEIKKHGGITFAQDPGSAAYGQMPLSAINAQVADHVLAVSDIVGKIAELMLSVKKHKADPHEAEEEAFHDIILLLRKTSGVDFTYYKQSTIRRRIARRMAITKTYNFKEYLKFLEQDKAAPVTLFNDLLIPVTSFFRDAKVFSEITETIFPALVNRSVSNSIRIWIAGCSTGQEAYSLAIALHEVLGENTNGTEIKIFATDVSELSITKARVGTYPATQLTGMPEAYLKKYFTKKAGGYQINRSIRDMCVFAVHNFLKDPPFARMDLITCRNVLIYMDASLQKKAMTTFHYALSEGGYLLLGKSETAAQVPELFNPVSKNGKIFSRKPAFGPFVHQHMRNKEEQQETALADKGKGRELPKTDFIKSAQDMILSEYAPASVVINEHTDIVHINGFIAPFIEFAQGKPTFNLLKIVREGLIYELRNAIHKAKQSNSAVQKNKIPLPYGNSSIEVTIEVRPLPNTAETYYLVVFRSIPIHSEEEPDGGTYIATNTINLKRISLLEKELLQTHADVNAITEEQEASNEELQSANEELLSGSEELQSLNEELETSKEELQSSNEELISINDELLSKQEQINISKNYTEAIIATLREPIVVLDNDLRIRNINRAFSKKYNIAKPEAKGKLIYEIQDHIFDNAMMRSMLEKVLPEKTQIDDYQISVDLQPFGESILLLNARQVTNEKSKEQLILLAIEDITERRKIEKALQVLSDGFEAKVKERTAELLASNTEFKSSVKDLNQANIRLQQFAYIASHDLQEPLRKILTFISILEEQYDSLPKDVVGLLTKIGTSSGRMKTLIHDLLAYSYLSNDNALFVTTDLNVVLKNILIDFELLIEQKHVDLKSGKLPSINAIPVQMNQLFYNIISNALKFSKTTTRSVIEITSKKLTPLQVKRHPGLDKDLSWCEIVFKDNGIGFDQKYEKKIFTIFQRLHTNAAYKGTGIGLAISHKIVENHGGIIFAKSKVQKGTTFHIILPLTGDKMQQENT